MTMRHIYYYLTLLALLPITGAAQPEHRRYIGLSDYPVELVKLIDPALYVSPEKLTDTLRISDNLYCVLNMSFQEKGVYQQDLYTLETAPEDDIYYDNYGKLSLFQNKELIFEQDSILFVTSIDYAPQYNKLIIPCVMFQSKDNLDEATVYHLVDLTIKSSQEIRASNSMQACITDDGQSVLYADMGDLYKYDINKKTSEYIISFGVEPVVVFNLSYRNNTLILSLYENWIDQYGEPIRKYTIPDIVL